MQKLVVRTHSRHYPILIGAPLTDAVHYVAGNQVMIVSQPEVYELYGEPLYTDLSDKIEQVDYCLLPTGEQHKGIAELQLIFDSLLELGHNRTTTILALGGGVVGDIAGFAAACYQRGVNYVQLPTTLLAQVDSSVGGKTAVNHPKGKNMIGAFYQPKAVVIDINTLATLPKREFVAGMAEVIKYGLIKDKIFLHWLASDETLAMINSHDRSAITLAIQTSCQTKAAVVSEDERESGVRAILNLGHTFGHAIESFTNYKDYLHGEAIAIGMLLAAKFSQKLGHIEHEEVDWLANLLTAYGLPTSIPQGMSPLDFASLIQLDKKNHNKKIRLVLMKSLGNAYMENGVSSETIVTYLQEIINEEKRVGRLCN